MEVIGRIGPGLWLTWRVGRRRLAYVPRWVGTWLLELSEFFPPLIVVPVAIYLANWIAALTATCVTWPRRQFTGRWTVVAYVLGPVDGDDRMRTVEVDGKRAATELGRRWAQEIKQQGQPVT
jgi:hypothetical protein